MSQHEIKAIEDIYRVVDENNLTGFLKDFEAWLKAVLEIKKIDPTGNILKVESFGWNDDGDNGTIKSVTTVIRQ